MFLLIENSILIFPEGKDGIKSSNLDLLNIS